jgi:transposase InsO family protein
VHLAVYDAENAANAVAFLAEARKAFPFRITHVLTDRGSCFTADDFERACAKFKVTRRTTKPYTPQTTDVIDKSFLAGSAIFSRCAWMTAWRRVGSEVRALRRGLYRRASFAASVRTFFGPREFQPETKRVYAPSACSTQRRSSSRWLLIL